MSNKSSEGQRILSGKFLRTKISSVTSEMREWKSGFSLARTVDQVCQTLTFGDRSTRSCSYTMVSLTFFVFLTSGLYHSGKCHGLRVQAYKMTDDLTGNLITMLRLLKNTKFQLPSIALLTAKKVRTIFETSDTGLLDALCDINTEGKMMSDRSTQNGSGEKKSRLTGAKFYCEMCNKLHTKVF